MSRVKRLHKNPKEQSHTPRKNLIDIHLLPEPVCRDVPAVGSAPTGWDVAFPPALL